MSFLSWLSSAIGNRRSAIGSGLRKPKATSRKPPRFPVQLLDDVLPKMLFSVTGGDHAAFIPVGPS